MKKLLLTLFLFLSVFDGFSQLTNIDSFYVPGSTWRWRNHLQWGAGGGGCVDIYYSYQIERDSTINGLNYHLVSGKDIGSANCDGPIYYVNKNYGIFGGIRVDGRAVYFLLFDTVSTIGNIQPFYGFTWQELVNDRYVPGVEKIISDFGLNLGDSLAWQPGLHVYLIDSIQLDNGLYAKTYTFTNNNQTQFNMWYEGIGNGFNLLAPYKYHTNLVCYEGYAGSYPYSQGNCTTGLDEPSMEGELAIIYPNPLRDGPATIRYEGNNKITSIIVYDISGKLCEQHIINSQKQALWLSVQAGLYFIRVNYNDGSHFVQKLTKL